MPSSRILEAALKYAAHGWPVFPSVNKIPIFKGIGIPKATTDEEKIIKWFAERPYAQISIVTGTRSGIFLIDIDNKNNKDGFATWKEKYGAIPNTLYQTTPHNGIHLLFQYPNDPDITLGCSVDTKLGIGIDTKGEGGAFIAAPSEGYQWCPNSKQTPMLPVPDFVIKAFAPSPKITRQRHYSLPEYKDKYAEAALRGILNQMEATQEGNRNNMLNALAYRLGKLIARKQMPYEATETLFQCAVNTGLEESKARATLESGLKAGIRDN